LQAEKSFCDKYKIVPKNTPEILVIRENRVAGYYSQLNSVSEADEESILDFIDISLESVNPLAPYKSIPIADPASCCNFIFLSGDNIGDIHGIYHRQNKTKFGHVHYKVWSIIEFL
jgi:hypothetical protein